MSTLFSIIIPCFNQAHYLPDCLESLIGQSYPNWEAIVVNDGSSDDTNSVANKYTQKDSRIKLVEKPNGGLSSARNYGINLINGERIIFLDADDFLYENCLMEIENIILEVNHNTLIQYGYTYITETKDSILHTVLPVQEVEMIPRIFLSVLGPCHSICISKTLCKSIGGFDESLKSLEDWDFWLRAAKLGGTKKTVNLPLAYYRYVRNSMSRNAFVMYESFKNVVCRIPIKDSRIDLKNLANKDYDINSNQLLQEALIRFLGVSIMQGKIDKSIELFHLESLKPISEYRPIEFESMCSYLSFRYWYSPSDIENVLENIKPNFKEFFLTIGYPQQNIDNALFYIFKNHYYYRNVFRFGKRLGSFLNFLFRLKFKQNK